MSRRNRSIICGRLDSQRIARYVVVRGRKTTPPCLISPHSHLVLLGQITKEEDFEAILKAEEEHISKVRQSQHYAVMHPFLLAMGGLALSTSCMPRDTSLNDCNAVIWRALVRLRISYPLVPILSRLPTPAAVRGHHRLQARPGHHGEGRV